MAEILKKKDKRFELLQNDNKKVKTNKQKNKDIYYISSPQNCTTTSIKVATQNIEKLRKTKIKVVVTKLICPCVFPLSWLMRFQFVSLASVGIEGYLQLKGSCSVEVKSLFQRSFCRNRRQLVVTGDS